MYSNCFPGHNPERDNKEGVEILSLLNNSLWTPLACRLDQVPLPAHSWQSARRTGSSCAPWLREGAGEWIQFLGLLVTTPLSRPLAHLQLPLIGPLHLLDSTPASYSSWNSRLQHPTGNHPFFPYLHNLGGCLPGKIHLPSSYSPLGPNVSLTPVPLSHTPLQQVACGS